MASDALGDWDLLPTKPDWATGFDEWTPGEAGASERVEALAERIADYDRARNLPSRDGSSRLSPHLHFGEVSPATVWHAAQAAEGDATPYLREIGWRDFTANMIDQFPRLGEANGRDAFDRMPWRSGEEADRDFAAWTQGRTGYPIVDAGMRELWATGWMHNRVRMLAASFLVKHLLIDWRRGARWFWDTLVDADYGNNSVNWQWIAGTGVDSNPFGRIMAPLSQSVKFDAADYIRRWVPELARGRRRRHPRSARRRGPRARLPRAADRPPRGARARARGGRRGALARPLPSAAFGVNRAWRALVWRCPVHPWGPPRPCDTPAIVALREETGCRHYSDATPTWPRR